MKDEDIENIFSQFDYLKQQRSEYEPQWIDASNYVSPRVYNWSDLEARTSAPARFSSTPCNYRNTLVSGLVGYSISPNIVWLKLSLENPEQLNGYGVKDWLEECESVLNTEFARSNLYQEVPKLIESGVDIGHGVMLIDEDIDGERLRFTKIRDNEVYLDIDYNGKINTCYREYVVTLRNAVSYFGLENLSKDLQAAFEDNKSRNRMIHILHAVYPREDYDEEKPDSKNMPFASLFIEVASKHVIQESGYNEFPYAVFEYSQIPGSAYSESPANNALPDIKTLNIIKKTSLEICQSSATPPIKASEDILDIELRPRGVTRVPRPDMILEPLQIGENYPVTLQILESVKQDVKDWFHVDFFLMLQSRQGQMTATEVLELQGEKAAVLVNLIVNLNSALTSVVSRSFQLLFRAGKIPAPPDALTQDNATVLKVDFQGTLAQAQKKYHQVGGIASALNIASLIAQMSPESMDVIDSDQLMRRALEGNGMPQSVIREVDDVEKMRQERAQQQQQQMQMQQQLEQSQSLQQNFDKLNKPVQRGSFIDDLNKQLAQQGA